MICLTDKSGRFAAMPMEMYHEAAKVHIEKDKEISFEEAEEKNFRRRDHDLFD